MRTFVIGDIHGGFKALMQCLSRSEFNKEEDKLIVVGDIADGYSEVPECVSELMTIKNKVVIRGNHDMWCRNWLLFGEAPRNWLQQGGKATVNGYSMKHDKYSLIDWQAHKEFFKSQVNYYVDESNRGFVHAGFTSRKGLGHEPYESNYFWDRDLWSLAMLSHGRVHEMPNLVKAGVSHARRFERHKELFIGHTATINYDCKLNYPEFDDINQKKKLEEITVPMNRCNIWNVDTGSGYKNGKLTIMDIETKKYWQSDVLGELYPLEQGR